MKERPILFSAPMVLAILAGQKSQTRRIVKWPTWAADEQTREFLAPFPHEVFMTNVGETGADCSLRRYAEVGDRLWVRETFLCDHFAAGDHKLSCSGCVRCEHTDADRIREWKDHLCFRADGEPDFEGQPYAWKPSIFMPRWASRLTLDVTGVRVEHLQEISEADAIAEGVEQRGRGWRNYLIERESSGINSTFKTARDSYFSLWESINGEASLAENPWVWAITFNRITGGAL